MMGRGPSRQSSPRRGALGLLGRRRLALLVGLPLITLLLLLWGGSLMLRRLGGAFRYQPEQMAAGLSAAARQLVERAYDGVDADAVVDHHVHVVGLGRGATGAFVHPAMQSWAHPIRHLKFRVYASAAAITDLARADQQYVDRLVRLARGGARGRFHILAFDQHYGADGVPNAEKTEFYVPNDYVFELARRHPQLLIPTISVHPYRRDAIAELQSGAARGARQVKWLPNAMGIDPADPRIDGFYRRMRELDLTLLTHAGEEKAVEAEEDQRLGNPLRLRRALDHGVRVVVAHCASLGRNPDLDDPQRPLVDNFDLFVRLMDDGRYKGLLFGDISAITQFNRLGKPLLTILRREDLQRRMVNGSDYPLPAINVIIRTGKLLAAGLINGRERELLDEIYHYNPLLFDFVLKRTLRLPGTQRGLSPAIFTRTLPLGAQSATPAAAAEHGSR